MLQGPDVEPISTVKVFPPGFVWGSATASYQIEGGWLEGGKGLSIWDAFAHTPGKISTGETGDVACDHYHRFEEDVALMARLGLKAYRFSISWPRIQPDGRGKPNLEGIRFYSNLIDALLKHGITPWVTLYHWDLPLALQLECDGWTNPSLAELFAKYAGICFEYFGDRVQHWITFNEPWVVAVLGYGQGIFAPGRISISEPYQAAHTMLCAHGRTVDLYREKFQSRQRGTIGMTNNCDWREPLTDDVRDRQAAEHAVEFFLGWFADPLYRGEYPEVMRANVKDRLPRFSPDDLRRIRGSNDFFGLNHYTTMYAAHANPESRKEENAYANAGLADDQDVLLSSDPAWERTAMGWNIVPWGLRKLLHWIHHRYDAPEIVITENGCAFDDRLENGRVDDKKRIMFLDNYLTECHNAIAAGVKVKGYFLWSLMDNFEWALGYSKRFGLTYVDFDTGTRIPKDSAFWYADLIRHNAISPLH